jgi:transcriptional regulator GlxA family with amidase domain
MGQGRAKGGHGARGAQVPGNGSMPVGHRMAGNRTASRASAPDPPHDSPRLRLRVGFVLANNFTLSALALFVDTLRLAADEGDLSRRIQCDWKVMSSGAHWLRASCGLEVHPDSGLLDPSQFDYIAVIGGVLHQGQQVDAATEDYLKKAAAAQVPLIGVCTGTFVLARAGLLDGRRCCVSWYHHSDMVREFANVEPVSDRLFLIDGNRITSSGGAGVADLAATLVNRHVGSAAAHKSLGVLLFESPRPDDAPQPLPSFVPQSVSPTVRRVVSLMEQNLEDPLPLSALAARAGVGERQLSRLFVADFGQPPAAVYRRIRVHYGRWLLEHSTQSVTGIAAVAGFADGAHFGKEFRRAFGTSPAEFRRSRERAERSLSQLPADRRPY